MSTYATILILDQNLNYFIVSSKSIVYARSFCLLFSFVDYVPVKGEIIWHLSLTA